MSFVMIARTKKRGITMPNWCNNNLRITGPQNKLKKLSKAAKDGKLFEYMVPMPTELRDTEAGPDAKTKAEKQKRAKLVAKYGSENWYEWACNNWGTKWDIAETYQNEIVGDTLHLAFDTAWGPALEAYNTYYLNNKDMSLEGYYYEPGCDFMGVWYDGTDDCYQVGDTTDKELQNELREFDDLYNILESREEYRYDLIRDGYIKDAKEWLEKQAGLNKKEIQSYIDEVLVDRNKEAHAVLS